MGWEIIKDWTTRRSPTEKEVADAYRRPPSLSDKLPWAEYLSEEQCFLLSDGKSVGAMFELSDVSSEARSADYLEQLRRGLQGVFQDVFPQYFAEEEPWIVQFYIQDELSLQPFLRTFENYIQPQAKDTLFSQHYLKAMQEHVGYMTQPQGIFVDEKVSGNIFRGKLRRIRAVIYRKISSRTKIRKGRNAIQDLQQVAQSFVAKLESAGVKVRRCQGQDFYEWMIKWFNPAPRGYQTPEALLKACPYPEDEQRPFGYDFAERLFFATPESSMEKGVWYFDKLPHKYLSITGVSALPLTGHLTVERNFGNHYYGLFDKFPEGSIFTLTVILESQEAVKNHLLRIERTAERSNSTDASLALKDILVAKEAIESGNYLFPVCMGVYLRGQDINDLYQKETQVETLLSTNGLNYIDGDNELLPIDSYLRFLPMCYRFNYDRQYHYRSRYLTGKQISQLLPLYGRERGTNHPALVLFNRGGEPLTIDPFHPQDKDFNSHLILLGTTGSGKSAMSAFLMMQLMAIYRPRLVVIDAGNSFGLLSDYFKAQGIRVNRVEIAMNNPVSLNPFAESAKLLEQIKNLEEESKVEWIIEEEAHLTEELETYQQDEATHSNLSEDEYNRDYMAEMCLAAQLMITGGEAKEQDKISRQDRMLIIDALILAAKNAEKKRFNQMIPVDLADAMIEMAQTLESQAGEAHQRKALRLREMADGIRVFCKDTVSALYFNQRGKPWPDADITVFEMGLFKEDGYEAQRALAFMGIMNKTMSLAEQYQHEQRFTVFYGDEVHIVTKNPLTAVSIIRCSKMSRKIGLWLWLASQNVNDFPSDARKMLSMMEFWLCLGMSEAEMNEVERFKPLTEEERLLFRSVRKDRGKYVEGVLLCNRLKALFRNIPPRLSLAVAMTEKEEKAERFNLMKQLGCSEVEAAIHVANKLLGKNISASSTTNV